MEQMLHYLDVEVYIDDIGVFSKIYEEHIETVDKVLQ